MAGRTLCRRGWRRGCRNAHSRDRSRAAQPEAQASIAPASGLPCNPLPRSISAARRDPGACNPRARPGPRSRWSRASPCIEPSATANSLGRSSTSPGDLFVAVAVCPEHLVALGALPAAKERLAEERTDVFPDDLSFSRHFEEAAEGRFGDERIAVWQALAIAHAGREKVPGRAVLVLPHDLVCRWIDLDDP